MLNGQMKLSNSGRKSFWPCSDLKSKLHRPGFRFLGSPLLAARPTASQTTSEDSPPLGLVIAKR